MKSKTKKSDRPMVPGSWSDPDVVKEKAEAKKKKARVDPGMFDVGLHKVWI